MPKGRSAAVGMKRMAEMVQRACPHLKLGYFNQPVR
jgi:hypothetical protein